MNTIPRLFNPEKDAPNDILQGVNSFFLLPVMPEYLTSDKMVPALYRAVGLSTMKDPWISFNGMALTRLFRKKTSVNVPPFTKDEVWKMLKDVLLCPEEVKQERNKKYPELLFLAPITPATNYFSNPIRLKTSKSAAGGGAWNSNKLFNALFACIGKDKNDIDNLWDKTFASLSVQKGEEEDCFAKIVEKMFESCIKMLIEEDSAIAEQFPKWEKAPSPSEGSYRVSEIDRETFQDISPLNDIRQGFLCVLNEKKNLSRWQWITMLDAQVRISVIAFLVWLLDLHHVASESIRKYIINGEVMPEGDASTIFKSLYHENHIKELFCYKEGLAKSQRAFTTTYARDYLHLAFFIDFTKQINPDAANSIDWSSVEGFVSSLQHLKLIYRDENIKKIYNENYYKMLEENAKLLATNDNRLKRIIEFFYVLRQRTVVAEHRDFIRYDQSYLLRRKSDYPRAPYIVDMGAMTCFTLVFGCANGRRVFSREDLEKYLKSYYIYIRPAHMEQFVEYLQGLGLTLDSPDADGGLMILNPFYSEAK